MWLIGSWLLAGFGFFAVYPTIKGHYAFKDRSYNDIIDSIKWVTGHRGQPHIKVDDKWRLLDIEEMNVANDIKPGDSLVKRKGELKVYVYRRDTTGKMAIVDIDN